MSRFCPLFSSSKGNSAYLSGGGSALLVDAGTSFRRLGEAMRSQNLELSSIGAILITHEHSDHIGGLATLLKNLDVPLFASRGTLEHLILKNIVQPHTKLVECTSGPFAVGSIEVAAFPTPHDAAESVGFRFTMPDQRKVAVATDLGHITETVREHLEGCDLVMLESNYDRGMLDCSPYPYYLKRRIKSGTGHLANEECTSEVVRLIQKGSTRFVLGHLSEQNNLPQIAHQLVKTTLEAMGMREDLDYILKVAPAHTPMGVMVF